MMEIRNIEDGENIHGFSINPFDGFTRSEILDHAYTSMVVM